MTDNVRLEKDTFGEIAVPNDKLWGAQTQRSLQNFKISSEKQSPELIDALAIVKRASAEVNAELKVLADDKAKAIIAAADEIIAGKHPDEFPLAVPFTMVADGPIPARIRSRNPVGANDLEVPT